MAKIQMEGISVVEGPRDQNSIRGKLTLPVDFPVKQFAVNWVKQGHAVTSAQATEYIRGTAYQVDGWTVWLGKDKKPCIRTLTTGAYVLMVRPKAVQENVKRISANLSRERLKNEVSGRTIAGQSIEDHGMLAGTALNMFERPDSGDANDAVESLSVNELTQTSSRVSGRATRTGNKSK